MSKLSADDRKTSAHLESLKSRLVDCLNSEKLDAEWRAKSAELVEETLFVGHARVDSTSGGEFYPQTGGGRIGKVEQLPEEKNKSQQLESERLAEVKEMEVEEELRSLERKSKNTSSPTSSSTCPQA